VVPELHVGSGELNDDLEVVIGEVVAVLAELVHDLVNLLPQILVVEQGHQNLNCFVAVLHVLEDRRQELNAIPDCLEGCLDYLPRLRYPHQQTPQDLLPRIYVDVGLHVLQLLADEAQGNDRCPPDVVLVVLRVLG